MWHSYNIQRRNLRKQQKPRPSRKEQNNVSVSPLCEYFFFAFLKDNRRQLSRVDWMPIESRLSIFSAPCTNHLDWKCDFFSLFRLKSSHTKRLRRARVDHIRNRWKVINIGYTFLDGNWERRCSRDREYTALSMDTKLIHKMRKIYPIYSWIADIIAHMVFLWCCACSLSLSMVELHTRYRSCWLRNPVGVMC